jgi:hypothetical protein
VRLNRCGDRLMERVGGLRVQLWEEEHRIMRLEWLKVEKS